MLHIALGKLPARCADQVGARFIWHSKAKCHAILQLITKPVRPAGLIKCGTGVDAARDGLVQQSSVQHDIHGMIQRFYLQSAKNSFPVDLHLGQSAVQINRAVFVD